MRVQGYLQSTHALRVRTTYQPKIKCMIFCSKHALQEKVSHTVEWSDLINFFSLERGEFFTERIEL